ncbi:outer membrane protein [Phaeospirillum tilakii]|uniref:Outer membrane protein n=1 Tax=Phaeospirillum tilakii TaxID=741673 RepID=A0ABW5C939_9PROT
MANQKFFIGPRPTIALALAVLACLPGVAARADQWDGWFIGVNAGAALADTSYHTGPDDRSWFHTQGYTADMWNRDRYGDSRPSPVGGLSVAYNTQVDWFVFGGELGLNGLDADLGHTGTHRYTNNTHKYTIEQRAEASGLATLRGRVGIAFDDSLLSLTGGLAATWLETGFDYRDDYTGMGQYHASNMKRQLKLGPTIGLAYEYMLPEDFVLKGEYSYVDLGRSTVSGLVIAGDGTKIADMHSTSALSLNILMIGIEKKF